MTSLFKRLLITLSAALLLCLPISGQDKHFEHNIYVGLGGAHSFEGVDDPYAFHIGYGLNYYLTRHWSIMPGISYRAKFEVGDDEVGIGSYDCSYFDIPKSSIISPTHVRAGLSWNAVPYSLSLHPTTNITTMPILIIH